MIYSILFVILVGISCWYWRHKYVPTEVAQNAADFKRNGSLDNLQRAYHSGEVWSRVWPGLACCVVPSLSFALSNLTSCLLGFAAVATLLLGVFVRDFTPKLNLARIANGETHLSEWFASGASKSWPDAGSWKSARAKSATSAASALGYDQQAYANATMKQTILRTYRLCLAASAALAAAAVLVAVNS